MKLILAVLGCVTFATAAPPAANKCDPKIIAAILDNWGDNIPSMIIATSAAKGKEVVIGTTEGYYPSDTKCVFSFFQETSLDISFVNKKGECTTTNVKIYEKDGVLIDRDTQIRRYEVYNKGGAATYYKCHDLGKDGKPEGMFKIKESGADQIYQDEAMAAMKKLGIQITQNLPKTCP